MNLRFFAIAAAILLVAASSGQSRAAVISFDFDPNGAGGASGSYNITTLDIAPGNALAHGAALGGTIAVGDTFELLYQARIVGGLPAANGFGLNEMNGQLTVVARFPEIVTQVTGNYVEFGVNPVGENYFEIYYHDTVTADDLTGQGFADGTKILSGRITESFGFFSRNIGQPFVDINQYAAANQTGQLSVSGAGGFQIDARVDDFDPNFFLSGFDAVNTLTFGYFDGNNGAPFRQTNPSQAFEFAGVVPDLGTVNGLTGPDFQFQADASLSFSQTVVPEPASLAVFAGLGVLGLGGVIRRRRQA